MMTSETLGNYQSIEQKDMEAIECVSTLPTEIPSCLDLDDRHDKMLHALESIKSGRTAKAILYVVELEHHNLMETLRMVDDTLIFIRYRKHTVDIHHLGSNNHYWFTKYTI